MPESPSIYTLSLKSTTVTSCLSADAMNIFLVAKSRMSFDTASTQSVATSQCKNGSLGSFSNRLGFTCCGAAPILYSLDFIPPRRVQRKLCFVNPTPTPPLFLTPNINSNTLCQQGGASKRKQNKHHPVTPGGAQRCKAMQKQDHPVTPGGASKQKRKQTSPCHTGRRAKMQSYAKARSPCYTGRRGKKNHPVTPGGAERKITLSHRAARKEKSPCHTGRRGKKNHPVTPGGAEACKAMQRQNHPVTPGGASKQNKTNITLSHRAARKDAKLCKSKITLLHRAARASNTKQTSPCHTGQCDYYLKRKCFKKVVDFV